MIIPFSPLPLLLVLLFSPLPSFQVQLECLQQDLVTNPTEQAADCRFLLSHLPTGPILNYGRSPPWILSLPFLPKAYIRHRSCFVQFTMFVSKPPVNLQSSNPDNPTPPVLEIWDLFREIGEQLVVQCIEKDRVGHGTSTYPWMDVMVLIGDSSIIQEACRERQRDQRRYMALPQEDPDNVWSYTIYDV